MNDVALHRDSRQNADLMTQNHSALLNQILWNMLRALGRVTETDLSHTGNPGEVAETFFRKFWENNHFPNAESVSTKDATTQVNDPREELAGKLIDTWVATNGPCPWAKAVEIVAIITGMSNAEMQRLLDLQGSPIEHGDLPG